MKFTDGQRVTVIALNERGGVLHSFVRKVYGQPDVQHYTVRTESGTYECSEDELAA